MDLFRATIARLERAKIAKTWASLKIDAGLAYDLVRRSFWYRLSHTNTLNREQRAESPAPEFISMGIYVDRRNQPQAGDIFELDDTLIPVPDVFLKLAKATELWYHCMPLYGIANCLTKDVGLRGFKFEFF
ncbi:hypothetical protein VC83_02947 [Pseudogymnoascus destructans]|uniref:Uncharacterized protein n=1 Tax=Pseudogymnoascus destructans TaxID=655981 RepID=A0A177AG26_9PEZI|nr:uncharacterized protein VC83_02947 [Pseudogymnoascus destructans]OAF60211.1 hypothetical protein VC83_02947 [Pseudogymnoascus destructans]